MFRLARILAALRPCRIDQWLYVSDQCSQTTSTSSTSIDIRHFTTVSRSGNSTIDSKISPQRECYAAFVDGHLAHQSWLRRDVLLPCRFGFSRSTPVIGDSRTEEAYRGRGIYPQVLARILADRRLSGTTEAMPATFILVAPDNDASVRGIERAGFRRTARLQGWRIGGLIWCKRRIDQVDSSHSP